MASQYVDRISRSRLGWHWPFGLALTLAVLVACAPASSPEERVQAQLAAEKARLAAEKPASGALEPLIVMPPAVATLSPSVPSATAPIILSVTPQPTRAASVLSEQDAVARVLPSIVRVSTRDGVGSGVILGASGQILTNAHVVGAAAM